MPEQRDPDPREEATEGGYVRVTWSTGSGYQVDYFTDAWTADGTLHAHDLDDKLHSWTAGSEAHAVHGVALPERLHGGNDE